MESKTTRNKKEEKAVKVCLCDFFFVLFCSLGPIDPPPVTVILSHKHADYTELKKMWPRFRRESSLPLVPVLIGS